MIAATQIKGIRAVNTQNRYAPFFDRALSELAKHGRDLFLQRCNGCHKGPGSVGGNVSERPYEVLRAQASYNPDYFKRLVVNPDFAYPNTAMPTHDDFDKRDLEALVAFLRETPATTDP